MKKYITLKSNIIVNGDIEDNCILDLNFELPNCVDWNGEGIFYSKLIIPLSALKDIYKLAKKLPSHSSSICFSDLEDTEISFFYINSSGETEVEIETFDMLCFGTGGYRSLCFSLSPDKLNLFCNVNIRQSTDHHQENLDIEFSLPVEKIIKLKN